MNVVKPPHSLVNSPKNNFTIFLAGSIDMGQAINWQQQVEYHFKGNPLYTLYNPRRDDWDSSWTQEYENPQFYQQVSWELNALDKCDAIIMYFAPDSKSPISLLELGLYANSGKISVVCPREFYRSGNVEITCEKYGIPLFRSLEGLLAKY